MQITGNIAFMLPTLRILGVAVSGLEKRYEQSTAFDSVQQNRLDETVDEIKRRYGNDKAMRALDLKPEKKLYDRCTARKLGGLGEME